MEFELLNELVENGYEAEDLDELFEFCVDFAVEYEGLVEDLADNARRYQEKLSHDKKIADSAKNMSPSKLFALKQNISKMPHKKKLGAAGVGLAAIGTGAAAYKRRKAKKAMANESSELLAKLLAK